MSKRSDFRAACARGEKCEFTVWAQTGLSRRVHNQVLTRCSWVKLNLARLYGTLHSDIKVSPASLRSQPSLWVRSVARAKHLETLITARSEARRLRSVQSTACRWTLAEQASADIQARLALVYAK